MVWPDVKKNSAFYCIAILLLTLVLVLRLFLSAWLTDYVNGVLYDLNGYRGSIEDLHIDLYRSAYRIEGLKVSKMQGSFPVPFIDIAEVDFSLHWEALIHGRVVSKVRLQRPIINFAIDKTGTQRQTGAEVDWDKPIRDLMPIDINEVKFVQGKITYRDFNAKPQVDIFVNDLHGEVHNLRNVEDKAHALPSTIIAKGGSIGGGKLELKGRMNILKNIPDMDIDAKLEHVSLPALNDYSDAYASIDFNKGDLSVYSQLVVKDEELSGYIKPIANDVGVIDLKRKPNPIKLVWESIASVVMKIFTNRPHDQFATKIELSGSLKNVQTDTWSAIGGIIHNAFIKAFDKKIDEDYKF
jgi:hypothetical protein